MDYGNRERVYVERLCALPPHLQKLPYLAREFFLKGIGPNSLTCSNGVWSKQATKFFRMHAADKRLLAQVIYPFSYILYDLHTSVYAGRIITLPEKRVTGADRIA